MSMWDDDAGYDRDDPKHPDWAASQLDRADWRRKAEREGHSGISDKGPDSSYLREFVCDDPVGDWLKGHWIKGLEVDDAA